MATSFLRTGRICCGLKVSECMYPSWRGMAAMTYSTKFGDPKKSTRRTHIKKAKPKPKLDVAQLLISLGMRTPARPSTAAKPAAMDVLKHSIPATPATPTTSAARASGTGHLAEATTPVPTVALPLPERPIPAGDSNAAPPPPTNELPLPSAPQHTEPVSTAESFSSRESAPLKQTEAKSAVAGIVIEAAIPPELTPDSSPPCAVDTKTPLEPPPASAVGSRTPLEPSLLSTLNSSAGTETASHDDAANYSLAVTETPTAPEEVVSGISPGVTAYPDGISHESRDSPHDPVSDASRMKASVPQVSLVSERAAMAAPIADSPEAGIITASPAQDAAVEPPVIGDHVASTEDGITHTIDTSTTPLLAEATSTVDISTTMATPTVAQTAEAEYLQEGAVVLGDVSEAASVVLGDVSEEAAVVLGDVSEEAAVLEANPDLVRYVEALSLLEVASFLESIPTLNATTEDVSLAPSTPAEDVKPSEIASQLEITPFLESSSVPDLTPHVEAISLLEVASFLETVPSPEATVASEDSGEPGPTLEDVCVPDLTSSVQAVGLLEVDVFLEGISALEEDPSPPGVSSQQAGPGDSLPGLDSTSLLEVASGLEDASVPDLTTHLEAVSLLEVAQFFETVPDTDTAAVRFESDSPAISTEEPPPPEGGTPSTDGPPLDHTSSWSTATGTSPEIDSTPTETSTEHDLASAGMSPEIDSTPTETATEHFASTGTSPEIDSTLIEKSPEVLGAAKSLQSDLESTERITMTIPTYPMSVDITMTTPTDSVSEHVTMTLPSLTEPISEVISVTSLDATPGGAGITSDEAAGVAQVAPAEITGVPVATQEPPPNMETGDVLGSAQIAAPREELSDSAPREELVQECPQSGMDPVQKLFLQKIREYQTLSQSPEGAVLVAAEFQQRLAEEEAKLQRLYGGRDLTEFPEFHFPEPRLDETSTK